MKIRKNVKALSPVVASIILIAVTVAVAIAVAGWMASMTSSMMVVDQIKITNMAFGPAGASSWIAVTVNNTGTSAVTINEAWINSAKWTSFANVTSSPGIISANNGTVIIMTNVSVENGFNYEVKLVSSKGNSFPYSKVAPNS